MGKPTPNRGLRPPLGSRPRQAGISPSPVGKSRFRGSPGEARPPPRTHLRVGALLRVAAAQYGARLILQLLVLLKYVDQRHHGLQLRLPASGPFSSGHPQLSPGPQLCSGGGGKSGRERRSRRRQILRARNQSQRKAVKEEGGATSDERKSLLSLLPPAPRAGCFPLPVVLPCSASGSAVVAMELLGEYVGPDGQRQQLEVPCESPGDADPFQSLLSGVAQMRELVAEHFGPLVQREAQDRVAAAPDEALDGDDDDDDAEDENNTDNRTNSEGPSAKRPKPPS
uniref:GON7 subunit of KEOPS complex n=2 Tax=Rhinolophus ferrumequinum TaxID=59479 RepID=A0A671E8E9_RHIFE